MEQPVDIRELNARIERESSFVDTLIMGMNKVIVGQKHLIEFFANWFVGRWAYIGRRCSWTC